MAGEAHATARYTCIITLSDVLLQQLPLVNACTGVRPMHEKSMSLNISYI